MNGFESCVKLRKRDNRDLPVRMHVNESIHPLAGDSGGE